MINKLIYFLVFLSAHILYGQIYDGQTVNFSGKIKDTSDDSLISNVLIKVNDSLSTYSDDSGNFSLKIPSNSEILLEIFHDDYNVLYKVFESDNEDIFANIEIDLNEISFNNFNQIEPENIEKLPEVIFQKKSEISDLGSIKISAEDIDKLPSITGGIEDILKTLPFVNTNSELSSQYMTRGGNYDENLVYINGIEIYKPQLTRSGQQEGLSIINTDMTSLISFSAGGFESRYGDKMSSVLDIYYKKPKETEISIEASLLGGSATVGLADKSKRFSAIVGSRYRNTDLLLNTLKGDTNFNPEYFDTQAYLTYELSDKLNFAFLGTYSSNNFKMVPNNKTINFGSINFSKSLNIRYSGEEKDKYRTLNTALITTYEPNNKWVLSTNLFLSHLKEEEYFDIYSRYNFIEYNENGSSNPISDIISQRDHARNDSDILIAGAEFKTKYKFNSNSEIEGGFLLQNEDIKDLMNEWQLIDSAGFSIPKPGVTPGIPNNGNIDLNYHINSSNKISNNRYNAYIQYTNKFMWKNNKMMINAGIRSTYWDFNEELNVSPRFQIAIKPDWKSDLLFRFATGFYYQPPLFKEMKYMDGSLNKDIKSQRSIHFILGNDYEFKLFKKDTRLFKLTTEIYYKDLHNLIPYYVDNVRTKYTGENNSKGYAYGIDARLNGEFIKGAESWISISYARTKENINGNGYIPRPTDQRLKLGAFFQDYMPMFPSMKASISFVYSSGLPNGAPLYSSPYNYQTTLSDYKRVDLGLTKVFIDNDKFKAKENTFWKYFKELSIGLEIFNLFDMKNTISNQWVIDINSPHSIYYAVPNKLTGRFFNAKLWMKF